MKINLLLLIALNTLLTYSQMALPINFEEGQVTLHKELKLLSYLISMVEKLFKLDAKTMFSSQELINRFLVIILIE